MGVGFYTEAGFGVRVNFDVTDFSDPKFDALKAYVWEHTDETTHNYYENVESLFNEDNFTASEIEDAFQFITFSCNTNNLADRSFGSSKPGEQWFAVAKSSFVSFTEIKYVDLSTKTLISPEVYKEIELLSPIVVDGETPRWYVWNEIG